MMPTKDLDRVLLCHTYIEAIKDTEPTKGLALYGADKLRREWHDKVCEAFGIPKEATKEITDHLDPHKHHAGDDLYLALKAIAERLKGGK